MITPAPLTYKSPSTHPPCGIRGVPTYVPAIVKVGPSPSAWKQNSLQQRAFTVQCAVLRRSSANHVAKFPRTNHHRGGSLGSACLTSTTIEVVRALIVGIHRCSTQELPSNTKTNTVLWLDVSQFRILFPIWNPFLSVLHLKRPIRRRLRKCFVLLVPNDCRENCCRTIQSAWYGRTFPQIWPTADVGHELTWIRIALISAVVF